MSVTEATTVHVMRHGQVENPGGVLYGRLPGYGLSELGQRMAPSGWPTTGATCR